MVILNRKVGEQFRFGDDVSVTVLQINRDGVKFGVHPSSSGTEKITESDQVSGIRCKGWNYYLFSQDGSCTWIVSCEEGTCLLRDVLGELKVIEIRNDAVTLGLPR